MMRFYGLMLGLLLRVPGDTIGWETPIKWICLAMQLQISESNWPARQQSVYFNATLARAIGLDVAAMRRQTLSIEGSTSRH